MDSWQPISTVKHDENIPVLLLVYESECPEASKVYLAWWYPRELVSTMDGQEYDGHFWICNDDEKQIFEDDYPSNRLFWMPKPAEPELETLQDVLREALAKEGIS